MRSLFGGQIVHLVVREDPGNDGALVVGTNTVVPLFTNRAGTTPAADFLMWNGTDYTDPRTQVQTDSDGYLPPFQGPDGIRVLYDAAGRALYGSGTTSYAELPAGTVVRVSRTGGAWPARTTYPPHVALDYRGPAPAPTDMTGLDSWVETS